MTVDLETFRPQLLAFASRMLRDRHEAEDVVQSAYLAALRDGPPPDHARAWLFRVVRNLAINAAKRRARPLPPPPAPPRESDADLERHLAALPDDLREILLLRYTNGLSFDEIADVVGRPAGTVKVYAGRALAELRRRMT